jgi:hypothetical protein
VESFPFLDKFLREVFLHPNDESKLVVIAGNVERGEF